MRDVYKYSGKPGACVDAPCLASVFFDLSAGSPASGQFAKLAANEDEDEQRGWQTEELQRGLQGEGGA